MSDNFVFEPGGDGPHDTDRIPPGRDPDSDQVGFMGPIIMDTKPLPDLPKIPSLPGLLDSAGSWVLLLALAYYMSTQARSRA
jgi:hypothetical protein